MRRGLSLTVWACTRFQAMLAILILALLTPAQHTDFCFNVAIPRSKRTGWLLTCW